MCIITEEGIKLSNGKKITFDNPDMSQLTKEELSEISSTPMMILGAFYLHKDLRSLKADIADIKSMLDDNLEEITEHQKYCPINKKGIKTLVDEHVPESKPISEFLERKWWDLFKAKIITAGNIAKAIAAVIFLLGLLLAIKEHI